MAKLVSEDEEYRSYLSILPAGQTNGDWVAYSLELVNGSLKMQFGQNENDDYLFCRKPEESDEIMMLCRSLENFLEEKHAFLEFEPAEPSFEFKLERVENFGVKVHIFVDAGNAQSEISRWDAFGLRFFTTENHLSDFINELKTDFAC